MSGINLLNRNLSETIIVSPVVSNGKNSVELEEEDYKIKIKGIPVNSVVIKTDRFPSLKDKLFIGSEGECKRSDYAIIIEDSGLVLLIELKAKNTTSSTADIKKQLKGGMCVIEYIKLIGSNFWGDANFLSDYKYRFVAIVDIKVDKQPTKVKPNSTIHDTVENVMKVTGTGSMYLKRLIEQPANVRSTG